MIMMKIMMMMMKLPGWKEGDAELSGLNCSRRRQVEDWDARFLNSSQILRCGLWLYFHTSFTNQNISWAVYKSYTLYKTDTYLWVLNFRLPAAREVRRAMSVSRGYRSVRSGGWGVGGGGGCRGRGVRRLRGVLGLLIVWFLRAIEDSAVLHRTALVLTRRCNWWRRWGGQDDQIPCGI